MGSCLLALARFILTPHIIIWALNTVASLNVAHSFENWLVIAVTLFLVNVKVELKK